MVSYHSQDELVTAEQRAGDSAEEGVPAPAERRTSEEEAECCLCMEGYRDEDMVRVLPCDHYFHKECIDKWFDSTQFQTRSCPLCKRDPLAAKPAAAAAPAPVSRMPAVQEIALPSLSSVAAPSGE